MQAKKTHTQGGNSPSGKDYMGTILYIKFSTLLSKTAKYYEMNSLSYGSVVEQNSENLLKQAQISIGIVSDVHHFVMYILCFF